MICNKCKCYFGEIFDINNEDVLEKFLEKNEWGIVFIDFVEIVNYYEVFFLDDVW